jgi:hypothetical protein
MSRWPLVHTDYATPTHDPSASALASRRLLDDFVVVRAVPSGSAYFAR